MPRNDDKFFVSHWDMDLTPGALAANDLDTVSLCVFDDDIFVINADIAIFWKGIQATTEHNLLYGLADSSLTEAEIEEFVEHDGPANRGQSVEIEKARRKVIMLGTLDPSGMTAGSSTISKFHRRAEIRLSVYNEGTATLGTNGLYFWIYNAGGSALTTGSLVRVIATMYARWM